MTIPILDLTQSSLKESGKLIITGESAIKYFCSSSFGSAQVIGHIYYDDEQWLIILNGDGTLIQMPDSMVPGQGD